jgi:Protein of unknown function (DUF2911)
MAPLTRHLIRASLALCLVLPSALSAQIRASERATISQTVDGTLITIDYARPRARGRDSLFGGEVKWGEIWTPGANWATTLETSRNITLDGHPVPAGKYSVWMQVQPEEWTLILDPRWHRFHINRPDSTAEQVRYRIQPVAGLSTETLTWTFSDVRNDGTTLVLSWGKLQVSLSIGVEASHPMVFSRDSARAYLGSYSFRWTGDADTVQSSRVTLTQDHDRLTGKWDPAPDPGLASFTLVHIADGWFNIATMRGGEVFEVDPNWVMEFAVAHGKATGFEVRGENDKLEGAGTRVK